MATFEYRAKTKEGEGRAGVIEAPSQEAALDRLHQEGLIVLAVEERAPKVPLTRFFRARVSQKDIVLFSRQLATLFEARVPIVPALKTLLGEAANPALQNAVAGILDDVAGGLALSQAMAKHPLLFSSFYLNLVRSGEESGKLQEVFTYLADYLERAYYLTTKARNSMIYPAFVLVAFVGVLVVMLVVVIPRLVSIFEETGQAVPFFTTAVIALSLALKRWGLLLLFLIAGGAIGAWRWSGTRTGRFFFHRAQLALPIFGGLYRKLYMARFADNLRTLIVGGIPIIRALAISRDVVGNAVYQAAIEEAIEAVKAGSTIHSALEKSPDVPVLVTQMIRIGESTGKLDFILGSVAKFYQREVDSALENLVALIEPILIVTLGAGVGLLLASVLIPLYNLVGSI